MGFTVGVLVHRSDVGGAGGPEFEGQVPEFLDSVDGDRDEQSTAGLRIVEQTTGGVVEGLIVGDAVAGVAVVGFGAAAGMAFAAKTYCVGKSSIVNTSPL